jgi:GTPase SAR1 family protein
MILSSMGLIYAILSRIPASTGEDYTVITNTSSIALIPLLLLIIGILLILTICTFAFMTLRNRFRLANPFRAVTCPYCNEDYYPGNCAIVATSPFKNISPGDILQKAHPGFLPRIFVTSLTGKKYVKTLAERRCLHCSRALPSNDDRAESYTIAIVGDGSSGKSHYIAACINQLRQFQALQVIGCNQIIGLGDTDKRYYNNYFTPIYLNKQKVQASTRGTIPGELAEPPLIYELVFPGKSINLQFYDSSGEDIIDRNNMVQYSHFILNASAIIFLADPMTMPGIVNSLPSHLQRQAPRTLSSSAVLNRVISTFRQRQGGNLNKNLKIPVAITLSKSDLLQFADRGPFPPLFLSDNVLPNQLDIPKFEVISNEIQTLIRRLGDQNLLKSSESFDDVSFFAVSATGWPEDNNGQFPAIEPIRCLDPLLWVLWRLGIIKVE